LNLPETKFVFVFDTTFFWSLLDFNKHTCIEDIAEIFKLYHNLDYIAPKTILYELQGRHKSKIAYLQQFIEFEKTAISDEDIKKLVELNQRSKTKYFEASEKGDYKIIQTALNCKTKNNVVMLVSNDEGIHKFVGDYFPHSVRTIWVPHFLSFLAKQAPEIDTREKLMDIAEELKHHIVDYRLKTSRGLIPLQDIEQILLSATLIAVYPQAITKEFQQFVEKNNTAVNLPKHLKKAGTMLQQILSYIELEDNQLVEEALDQVVSYVYTIEPKERENTKSLIAPYLIKVYSSLASIYDKNGELSGAISALERAKELFPLVHSNETTDQIYAMLSWIHLFSGSVSLAFHYFKKIENLENQFVKQIELLLQLSTAVEENIKEEFSGLLSVEKWTELLKISKISQNEQLKHKLQILVGTLDKKPKFFFDARHFNVRNAYIRNNDKLSFLLEEYMVIELQMKKEYCILRVSNPEVGEIEWRMPKIEKIEKVAKGDCIYITDGIVEKISKPRPGVNVAATVYLQIKNEDVVVKKESKLI